MKKQIARNDIAFLFKLIGDNIVMRSYPSKARGKKVLKMAWMDQMSLADIGRELSVTRERAKQLYEAEKGKLVAFVRSTIDECKNHTALRSENEGLRKQIELFKKQFEMLQDDKKTEFERLSEPTKIILMPIENLYLSTRARKVLNFLHIKTVGDLMRYGIRDLLSARNCGLITTNEIKRKLKRYSISTDKKLNFVFASSTN